MHLLTFLEVVLIFLLSLFVSGNNLSAAVGTLIGSRIISRIGGTMIGMIGFITGFALQGKSMEGAAHSLFPAPEYYVVLLLLVVIAIFIIAQILKSPLSLSMALVGTAIGISLRLGLNLNFGYVYFLILIWVISPMLAIAGSFAVNRYLGKVHLDKTWNMTLVLKLLLLVISFFTAYTIGSNTIGLMAAFAGFSVYTEIAVLSGIILGSLFLSKGVLKRVGEDMYSMRYFNALTSLAVSSIMVEAATLFSIPLSSTQALTSSVFGAGLSYRYKALFLKPYLIVVLTWVISPLTGLIIGYII